MSKKESTAKAKKRNLTRKKDGRIATLASQMPAAPAGVLPPTPGSRTRIWKQDPSVKKLAVRDVYVHTRIHPGPRDSQIEIVGLPTINADINGDFLFEPSSSEAFDSVHSYTVVRQVLTMYQRVLDEKMKWQWNRGSNKAPISVFPHAGDGANAYYSRTERALKFFYFRPPGAPQSDPLVYTCRSFDIVSHEVGHAVLDALQPGWLSFSAPPQTGGIHESFGDLTSIFMVLSQLDQVEFIIGQTKADLHQKNVLAEVAEEFGTALGRPTGLRNADNNLKLSQVSSEVHDISKVLTGGIYDTLADAFTASRDSRRRDDAEVLYLVGRNMVELTTLALKNAPPANAIYADVVNEMILLAQANPAKFPNYDTFLKKHFEFREVIGPDAVAGPQPFSGFAASRTGCCGTMQNIEYEADS